ncbi:MAG: DNA methyltransferase [Phycisphaerae bacterium]
MTRAKQLAENGTLKERASAMTSIVSYPKRCSLWGDGSFCGNCDGRLFLGLVLRYRPELVADPMMGSGTTRDVIDWLNRTEGTRIQYWGGDLSGGFNLHAHELPGRFDLIWLHPPYWNIIRYSDDPADLSTCDDYGHFVERLRVCLRRCYDALTPGGRLAVLVGDVRRRGSYKPIVRDVMNMEGELGRLRSVIIKAQHNCRSDRISYSRMEDVPIQHEYCVVFRRDR